MFVVTSKGELVVSGYNKFGQLGLGYNATPISVPTVNSYFRDYSLKVRRVSHSPWALHTMILASDGVVYAVGFGSDGRLGLIDTNSRNVPCRIEPHIFMKESVVDIACGYYHSAFVTQSGAIWPPLSFDGLP